MTIKKSMAEYVLLMTAMLSLSLSSRAEDNQTNLPGSEKLTGTPIGSSSGSANGPEYAFDSKIGTYYASSSSSRTWVGLDLGRPCVISHVG